MKREEERIQASEDYRNFRESCGIKDPIMLDEIEEAHYEGSEWADKTIIDKACEWMEHHLLDNVGKSWKEVCDIFRKAMEG